MELRHLRYFVAVAEEATYAAAARRLAVAQPALTRQIHALEWELDVELLERGPKGVALTPAGEVALVSARHVLRQVDAAVERARGSSEGIVRSVRDLCGDRSLSSGLIGRIVERVRARYPAIEIGVIEGVASRQVRAVELGERRHRDRSPCAGGLPPDRLRDGTTTTSSTRWFWPVSSARDPRVDRVE